MKRMFNNCKLFKKVPLLMSLLMTLLLVPSYAALPDARHVASGGEVFLGGDYLEIGIRANGAFGTSGSAPSGFHTTGSRSNIGLSIDQDGFDTGADPTTGDFFLPGGPYEGFFIGYYTGGAIGSGTKNVYGNYISTTQITSSTTDTSSGDTLSAQTIGTTSDGNLKYTQTISFDKTDKFYAITIDAENLSASTLYDVRYTRSFDPDQDYDLHYNFATINQVHDNPDVNGKALVSAIGPDSGEAFFFMSTDPDARAAISTSMDPYNATLYNTDGNALIQGPTTQDTWIAITTDLGDIAVGETKSITFYSSLNADVDTGLSEISTDYTVTFDSDGGSSVTGETLAAGANVTEPTDPTKTGYTFDGWYSDSSLTTAWDFSTDTMPESNLTLYAKWTAQSYTVTFDSNGGSSVANLSVVYGGSVTEPTGTTRTGYSLSGWYTDSALTSAWDFTTDTMPASDMTLYADWSINNYTVTFDSNGGSSVANLSVVYGGSVTEPTGTTRTGYNLSGWYTDSALTTAWDFTTDAMPASDMTLYAGWSINSYTLSYNSNGGTSLNSETVTYTDLITAPTSPSKTGYTFSGWYSDSALTTAWDFTSDTMPASDTTLYAKWSLIVDTDLTGLSVSGYSLSQTFDPATTDYAVFNVTEDTVSVTATADASTYGVISVGNTVVTSGVAFDVPLSNGGNVVTITVTAQDNSTKDYILVINKLSDKANLLALEVDGENIVPSFTTSNTSYTVNVTTDGSLYVTVVPESDASVDLAAYTVVSTQNVNMTTGTSLTYSTVELTPAYGTTVYTFTVNAQNGIDSKAYLLSVINEEGDADLSSLKVNGSEQDVSVSGSTITYNLSATTRGVMTITPTASSSRISGMTLDGVSITSGETQTVTLALGANTFTIVVTAENGDQKTYVINITRKSSSTSTSSGGTATTTPSEDTVEVIVNGVSQNAGTEKTETVSGKTTTTVIVNKTTLRSKIAEIVAQKAATNDTSKNTIVVPVKNTTSKAVKAQLTGDLVKEMEDDAFDLTVSSNDIDYTIPAKEVKISNVAASLGIAEEDLEDIVVDITVDKLDDETSTTIIAQATNGNLEVVYPPVSFTVEATVTTAEGETKKVEVSKFSSYVSRKVALPSGVDVTKITTGVVYNEDGTFSHIPTRVVEENGVFYAVMNSPTNSSYSVVYHEVTVEGALGHWSEAVVNKLASRMIIDADETFNPDEAITRGAFIAYITKGLGIYRSGSADMSAFTDMTSEYADAITIAKEYGIVSGYEDGSIRPDGTITREEAMVMLTQALNAVTILEGTDAENVSFSDEDEVSAWAQFAVDRITSQGIMNGVSSTELSPQGIYTYAEAAATINNMLVKADLINE